MKGINKNEISFLIKPLFFVSFLVALFVSGTIIGFNQITSIVSKIDEAKKTESLLNQKIFILEKVSEKVSGDTTFLDIVIPNKSAVLYGLSQIKNQAVTYNLLVSNIKIGNLTPDTSGVNKALITFDIEGDESSIYTFLNSFSRILPIMNINKVKINKSGPVVKATATLNVYSSELPKTIPSVSSSAPDLSAEEINLLKELSTYTLPVFSEPKAQETQAKEDPFK